jgi:hypothetical protein
MKAIEFKKLPKDIIDEGITIELLNKVQYSGKFSPAMMQKGDEPITLIKANNEAFWIQLEDGSFLKDKGKLLTFGIKECIIARARYWTLFSDTENAMGDKRRSEAKEREINKEVLRIQTEVKKEAEEIIEKFREMERYAEDKEGGLSFIMKGLNPVWYQSRIDTAKQFIESSPGIKEKIDSLEESLKAEDYDSIYMMLKTNGLPLVVSFSIDNDMDLAKRFFHKDKIDETIEIIKDQSHIKNVAMFNVNKRYT